MANLAEITKIYYTPPNKNLTLDNNSRLIPAPMISLSMVTDYASEASNIVVGYRYIITLDGMATAYRANANANQQQIGFRHTNISINIIRKILSTIGGVLHIVDGYGNYLLKAKGGTLRSLEFADSDNHLIAYSPYRAELEFNEVELAGASISCDASKLNVNNTLSTEIVDITKYKLKTFSETLTINLADDLYSSIRNIGIASPLTIENSSFIVNYSLSATGKHHYKYNSDSEYALLPAWEQAKNFCQDRLFEQVGRLVGNILRVTAVSDPSPCSNDTMTIENFDKITNTIGAMSTLDNNYKVYNETIQCSASESDGTFDITYNSLIKKISNININRKLGSQNTNHKIIKTINHAKDTNKVTTISINGSIEGLIEGGLVTNSNGTFNIPSLNGQAGKFIIQGNNILSKYDIAKAHLDTMLNDTQDDFHHTIKPLLGITFDELGLNDYVYNDCELPNSTYPEAAVFNLTHNYHEGIINYVLEYNSMKGCGKNLANISINVEKPVTVFATFKIPDRQPGQIGTILQNLGTVTAPKINISIQGRNDSNMICCNNLNSFLTFDNICHDITLPNNFTLPNPSIYTLTTKTKQTNLIDGSYTINLGYIISQ